MAEYDSRPIYRQSIELVVLIERAMAKTARNYRYTFGQWMVDCAIGLPNVFYMAFDQKDPARRLKLIDAYIYRLVKVRACIDVAHQLGLFYHKDYPMIVEAVDSLDRQSAGWRKKTAGVPDTKGVR